MPADDEAEAEAPGDGGASCGGASKAGWASVAGPTAGAGAHCSLMKAGTGMSAVHGGSAGCTAGLGA